MLTPTSKLKRRGIYATYAGRDRGALQLTPDAPEFHRGRRSRTRRWTVRRGAPWGRAGDGRRDDDSRGDTMGELRVGASVRGTDGELGTVDALVIDPVRAGGDPRGRALGARGRPRRCVPIACGHATSTPAEVTIDLDAGGVRGAAPRSTSRATTHPTVEWQSAELAFEPGAYYLEPFASPLEGWSLADHERIPLGRGHRPAGRRGRVVGRHRGRPRRRAAGRSRPTAASPTSCSARATSCAATRTSWCRSPARPSPRAGCSSGSTSPRSTRSTHLPVKRHGHVVATAVDGHDDDGV